MLIVFEINAKKQTYSFNTYSFDTISDDCKNEIDTLSQAGRILIL